MASLFLLSSAGAMEGEDSKKSSFLTPCKKNNDGAKAFSSKRPSFSIPRKKKKEEGPLKCFNEQTPPPSSPRPRGRAETNIMGVQIIKNKFEALSTNNLGQHPEKKPVATCITPGKVAENRKYFEVPSPLNKREFRRSVSMSALDFNFGKKEPANTSIIDESETSSPSLRSRRILFSKWSSPFSKKRRTSPTSPKASERDVRKGKERETAEKEEEKKPKKPRKEKSQKFTRDCELGAPSDHAIMAHKKRQKADSQLIKRVVDGVDMLTRVAENMANDGDIDETKFKRVLKPDSDTVIKDTIKNVFPLIDKETRDEDPIKTDENVRGALNREKNLSAGIKWASEQLEDSGELKFFDTRLKDAKKKKKNPDTANEEKYQNGSSKIRINHPGSERRLNIGRNRAETVIGSKVSQNNRARPRALTELPSSTQSKQD